MGFAGLSDQEVKEELARKAGVARPGVKDYLMDFMSIAPMMMGFPAGAGGGKVLPFPGKKGKVSGLSKPGELVNKPSPDPEIVERILREDYSDFLRKKRLLPPKE